MNTKLIKATSLLLFFTFGIVIIGCGTQEQREKKREEKRKADAKEAERLRNFKPLEMYCNFTYWDEFIEINWTYDGKTFYMNGLPYTIGVKEEGFLGTTLVKELSRDKKFKISIATLFGMEEYTVDFSRNSTIVEIFGSRVYPSPVCW